MMESKTQNRKQKRENRKENRIAQNIPSQSLTWNLKMALWNRRFLLETIILGSMLNLRGVLFH